MENPSGATAPQTGVSLAEVVARLRAITDVDVVGEVDPDRVLTTRALIDASDLEAPTAVRGDLVVLTGEGARGLPRLAASLAALQAPVLLTRSSHDDVPDVLLDRTVLVVPRGPVWAEVLTTVLHLLTDWSHHIPARPSTRDALAQHTDLFDVAKALGFATRTLISIEDEQARILAFSPYSDQADPIRRMTILGREPPAWHLTKLRRERVYDRLRVPEAIVELPESQELRRRMGVGMADTTTGEYLGTIWAQELDTPFGDDLPAALREASRYATRLVLQSRRIHSMGTELVQRLLAPEPASTTYAPQLRVREPKDFVLVGFEVPGSSPATAWLNSSEAVALLSMRASVLGEQIMVAPYGDRLYVVSPGPPDIDRHTSWAERTVEVLRAQRNAPFRAALSSSVSVPSVRAACAEIERVCTRTPHAGSRPVVTLESDRTAVLLAECLEALPGSTLLSDERLARMLAYDEQHRTPLVETVRTWLSLQGEFGRTATVLKAHVNTVRYRVARLEEITGYDLDDPDDRLVLELQLRLRGE